MQIPKPNFGQPQNDDPYVIPQPGSDKKKQGLLMFGGLAIILLILGVLISGGKSAGGEVEMKSVIDETGESIGIITTYDKKLKSLDAQNDIALVQIILRGNYQKLGALYQETYGKKKTVPSSPKADVNSINTLDAAVTNDTIDTEIFEVLSPKISSASKSLGLAKSNFTKADSLEAITTAQTDFESLNSVLNKQR
ncbi:hypothetical protein H6800_02320 [Candidatus Nomurabacteria bacterium]|nr:hypothetical protein [Candidatus Nomurabacteria bacterium]